MTVVDGQRGQVWLRWVGAALLGGLAGEIVVALATLPVFALLSYLVPAEAAFWLTELLGGLVLGAALGWAQWRVLRRALPMTDRRGGARWTMLSALGVASIFLVLFTVLELAGVMTYPLLGFIGLIGGAIVGTLQWAVLAQHGGAGGRWPLANGVAWAVALLAGEFGRALLLGAGGGNILFEMNGRADVLRAVLLGVPVFALVGLISGAVLNGIVRGLAHDL